MNLKVKQVNISSGGPLKKLSDEQFYLYENQIMQRVEVALGGLISLGLKTRILEKEELIEVFYNLYNPTSIENNKTNPKQND